MVRAKPSPVEVHKINTEIQAAMLSVGSILDKLPVGRDAVEVRVEQAEIHLRHAAHLVSLLPCVPSRRARPSLIIDDRFSYAMLELGRREGGWVKDPDDPGGETYFGITRRDHPDWAGWELIDSAKREDGFPHSLSRIDALGSMVRRLYRDKYWIPARCEEFPEPVGEILFDIAVNSGRNRAWKFLQGTLNALDERVKIDGVVGPKTLEAVSKLDPEGLGDALQSCRFGYYMGLIAARKVNEKFEGGWVARALEEYRPEIEGREE